MRLASLYRRLGRLVFNHPSKVIAGCLLFASCGAYFTARIEIKADLTALLPKQMESVRGLEELKAKFGGVGYLLLAIEAEGPEDAIRFIDALHPLLQEIPDVRYVNDKRPLDFFLDRFPLYLEIEDLNEIEQKLLVTKEEMKKGANPLFGEMLFSLDDGPSFSDIMSRYEKRGGVDYSSLTEYYQNEDGTLFAVLIKPSILSLNLQDTRAFVQSVRATVDRLRLAPAKPDASAQHGGANPDSPPPSPPIGVRVSYGGDFVKVLEQEGHLKEQMGRISGAVLALLMLVLIIYYRRLSPVFSIGISLLAAMLWTGGIVYFILGHVNLVTGFSVAVMAGLGSDYGIYLLSRFLQERDQGHTTQKAFQNTFSNTSLATRGSAITTMIAFGVLCFSRFKGFSEFGVIGLVGTFSNLLAMHTFFPALLVVLERNKIMDREKMFFPWSPRLQINKRWLRLSLPVVIIFLSVAAVSAYKIPGILHIQYDRNQIENTSLHAYEVDKKINPLFNSSLYPSVIMIPSSDKEEKEVLNAIKVQAASPAPLPMIQRGTGLTDFIPEYQEEKATIIERIQKLLREMKPIVYGKVKMLRRRFEAFKPETRITHADLPPEIVQTFVPPSSTATNEEGRLIYLFPKRARDSTERVLAFADQAGQIRRNDGQKVTVLGDTMIIADIIRLIEREALPIFVLVMLLCFLVLVVDFRSLKAACLVISMLAFSVLLYLGGVVLFKLHFNLFNLIAPPIIVGTGCDSFIHFFHRYREQKYRANEVINTMAPSISTANLTTAIGFGGLIMTDNAGLRSTGWMVVIGMAAVTLTALVFLPSVLTLYQQWRGTTQTRN